MPITLPQAITLGKVYEDLVDDAEDLVGAASRIAPAAAQEVLCSIGGALSLGGGPGGIFTKISPAAKAQSDLGGILEAACPMPPPVPLPPGPPFPGGQCPVLYRVTYNYDQITTFSPRTTISPQQSPRLAMGPFSGFELEQPRVIQGQEVFGRIIALTGAGRSTWHQASSNTGFFVARVLGVVREDGLPDECGNLPGPPIPPRPPIVQPPRSPDIPRVDPDGNPLPPIYFEPRIGPINIGPRGEVSIPVTVNVGGPSLNIPISIPVNVSLPDFKPTINFGGRGGTNAPGEPSEPGPPQGICCPPPPRFTQKGEEEDPEEPPEEQPEDGVIVGINVTTAVESAVASATIIGTAQPPLRVPRIATVQFGTGTEGSEFIGADTQVKQLKQFVAAPADVPITRAFVRWEPGWGGEFEYVYAPKNPESSEEEGESPPAP